MEIENFFLICPFHWLTGLDCPLCGMQRALWALLHLHFIEAFQYNPWLAVLAPYTVVVMVSSLSERVKTMTFPAWCCKERTMLGMLVLTVIWGIVRNFL